MELIYPEKKIDAKTAGALNGVSAKTVIRWAQAGMPHFHFEKKYLFYQSEIEKFMERTFGVNRNIFSIESSVEQSQSYRKAAR